MRGLSSVKVKRGSVLSGAVTAALLASVPAFGQTITTSLNPSDAVFKSTGGAQTNHYNLWSEGYVGTFIQLDQPGEVEISINAGGTEALNIWPTMGLHIGDQQFEWTVNTTAYNTYTANVTLPAGTYHVRTEFLNDHYNPDLNEDRNLLLNNLTFSAPSATNLTVRNPVADAAALRDTIFDASDSHVEAYRKRDATVSFLDGSGNPLSANTQVQVKLKRHAFDFGTAFAGSDAWGSPWLSPNPTPGSDVAKYQQALVQNFNSIVPENAGKWGLNENTRDIETYSYVDQMLDFAEQHQMRARYHGVLWENQQPQWAIDLENAAIAGDASAAAELRAEISERIQAVINRSDQYLELDGINESYHVDVFTQVYGMAGVADIYNEIIDAAESAGSPTKVFFNEYGALQNWSGAYGDWYRAHIEEVIKSGITEENQQRLGVGMQYYANPGSHDVERFYRGLQNLATLHLPMTLTEFGVDDVNTAEAPQIMADAMRMIFGTDQLNGFLAWGFWSPQMWLKGAALYDEDWNLTEAGKVWQQLTGIHDWGIEGLPFWTTDLTLLTDEDGQIDFRGFIGEYDVIIDGVTMTLTVTENGQFYTLQTPEPGAIALVAVSLGLLLRRPRRTV